MALTSQQKKPSPDRYDLNINNRVLPKSHMHLAFVFLLLLLVSCSRENKPAPPANPPATVATNAAAQPTPPAADAAIQFPRDEGAHYDQPIEWWYLNSQLTDTNGKKYAFFFCAFRGGRHLVSLFDKQTDKVIAKDYLQGMNATENGLNIDSPSLKWRHPGEPFTHSFKFDHEGLTVELTLKANKKPFFPGSNGAITMGEKGKSRYYALTDLAVTGTIAVGSDKVTVTGKGWFDHQWGIWDWVNDFHQWKWYSVKLDNGVDLMLFNFYKDKKLIRSEGGYMDADGNQFHNLACELVTRKYYTDRHGKWQKEVDIEVTSLPGTKITLVSEKDEQFIEAQILWEGSMTASGTFKGKPVSGTAYGELNRPD